MAGKKVRQVATTTYFKWKADHGNVKSDLTFHWASNTLEIH